MRTFLHLITVLVAMVLDGLFGPARTADDSIRGPIVRFIVKYPWSTAAAVAGVLGTGAVLVVTSGIVSIKASSGHWPITAWLLDFAKLQSVRTHSFGISPPELDDEALVLRGASHYAIGCHPCHGGPGSGVPPVMAAMTPPPPELTGEHVSRWKPEHLFSIVKHGIKLTGMPAWPAQSRDDEVWAVVAFLRRMPNLDVTEYRRLAYGDFAVSHDAIPDIPAAETIEPPRAVRDLCWRCHGVEGMGRGPGAFPRLAGQRPAYLYRSLRAFADRTRFSGTMSGIAATLSDSTMREVAMYYERLTAGKTIPSDDSDALARGAGIANRGIPDRDIPPCVECHGPSQQPKNPAYPRLAGQHPQYLRLQLQLLKERRRGGSPNVNLMHAVIDRLGPAEMRDVTLYYAALKDGK